MQSGASRSRRRVPRPTRTFVSLTGPAGNIGDALIRRRTLEWARGTSEQLVAYVGDAPDEWMRQLGVASGTRVLRSKRSVARWLWSIATAPRHPVLVFEAGEVPLDRGNGLRELVFLAETIVVRLKRGIVVRPPRGIRAPSEPARWLHARAARLSQFALWRDADSAELAGVGVLAPDIGFAAGVRPGLPDGERDELIVSLRGARPFPDAAWSTAVRSFAAANDVRIRTVVQVREDENRAGELAQALGGTVEPWGDRSALEQEALLRERYDRARLVISDRMHVLVLAALSGAVPVELVPHPTAKIAEAFRTIGLAGISHDASATDAEGMARFLAAQLARTAEVRDRVSAAAARLVDLEAEVRAAVRAGRA
ncbi:MAG: hypothetical protein QM622_07425 [Microbacterium sp.]